MSGYVHKLLSSGSKPVTQSIRSVDASMPGVAFHAPTALATESLEGSGTDSGEAGASAPKNEMGMEDRSDHPAPDSPLDWKDRSAEPSLYESREEGITTGRTFKHLRTHETSAPSNFLPWSVEATELLKEGNVSYRVTHMNMADERAEKRVSRATSPQGAAGTGEKLPLPSDKPTFVTMGADENVNQSDRNPTLTQTTAVGQSEGAQSSFPDSSPQKISKLSVVAERATAVISRETPGATEPNHSVTTKPASDFQSHKGSTHRPPKADHEHSQPLGLKSAHVSQAETGEAAPHAESVSPPARDIVRYVSARSSASPKQIFESSAVPQPVVVEKKTEHHRHQAHIREIAGGEASRKYGWPQRTESTPTLTIQRLDIQIIGQTPEISSRQKRKGETRTVSSGVSEIMDRHHLGRYSLSL